jgi:hypothetical protein
MVGLTPNCNPRPIIWAISWVRILPSALAHCRVLSGMWRKHSKNVKLLQYGTTNEGRPLLTMFIGSEDNINRLEAIRKYNLSFSRTGERAQPLSLIRRLLCG